MAGENLDLSSEPEFGPASGVNRGAEGSFEGRRYLGVQFACCSVYARVYLNRASTAYTGNCPKCSKPVRFQVGPGGTDSRFFTAY